MKAQTPIAIKICGITQIDQALQIASLGVDAIGVIGVESSPRFLAEVQRRKLFESLMQYKPVLERVWVIANLDANEIKQGLNGIGLPTIVQLHGNESKEVCRELKNEHPKIKFWKSFQIRNQSDLLLARSYQDIVDAILLDSWSSNTLGGTGKRISLNLLAQVNFKIPWWLAGGISKDCIEEISSKVKPFGIDASSKLEIEPGIKDLKEVELLIKKLK